MQQQSAWVIVALSLAAAAACSGGGRNGSSGSADTGSAAQSASTRDTTAGRDTSTRGFVKVGETNGLKTPESAFYDRDLDVWFVSNINGDPTGKDNNGFIARIGPDGKVDSLKFIEGGKRGVTLNAPKGMAVVGDTLWVADIDAARAFNKRTGAPIATVSLAGKAKFLNDAAAGPEGIYFTDSGLDRDSKGQLQHSGPDRIYRIGRGRQATLVLQHDSLAAPNGIVWLASESRFVVVPFAAKSIETWAPGDKAPKSIGIGPGMLDGVEPLAGGRLLITSWADSSLFVLENGLARTVVKPGPSPADIGIDTKRNRVAVPLFSEDRVEYWAMPASLAAAR